MKQVKNLFASLLAVCLVSVFALGLAPYASAVNLYDGDPVADFEKILLSEEIVVEDGVVLGTLRMYELIPSNPITTYSYNTSYYEARWEPKNGGYVSLMGIFMYDGESVSCIETSVTHDIADFVEESRDVTGNGTRKSTAKLKYNFQSYLGTAHRSLSVWCDKDGKHGATGTA